MEQRNKIPRKPAIAVGKAEYEKLTALAELVMARNPNVAGALIGELERARIKADGRLDPHVVRMGSTVEYTTESGETRRVTLVFPADADISQGRISILTPVGVALLGLSPGQSIDWATLDGARRRLTVGQVTHGESVS
ncbi:MAG: nucleoside diphosphate kinase regulator [Rhodobiaceae bacterium]|nr:nucleoside diphosphate kinase regulator [Rhodobiaceae bacterium]